MTYNDAVLHAWLSQTEIAEFFSVSIQTVQRWAKSNKAPTGVIQALKLIAGDCPTFSAKSGWDGWAFSGGYLWSPNLEKYTSGDIRASRLDRDIIKGYEREVLQLKDEVARLRLAAHAFSEHPRKTAQIIRFPSGVTDALRLSD
jgi:transcriptional regulator with XRE-family HTH domain